MKNIMKQVEISVIIVTWNRVERVVKCIKSVLSSSYANYEIVVVDNGSTDNTYNYISKKFPQINLIRSNKNLLASGGRNLGAANAKGKYLLFIDDDNIIDKKMIEELIGNIKAIPRAGLIGPKMYYLTSKKTIWYAGADINKLTSKTSYFGIYEKDKGQYSKVKQVGHIPNAFMIKRDIFNKIGKFDIKNFLMHYEEADLAERVRQRGYKVLLIPKAITYHDTPLKTKENKGAGLALNNAERAYYNLRNRVVFMKKYGINYPIFIVFFLPLFFFFYLATLIKIGRPDLIRQIFYGVKDGLFSKV